jgi:cell division protein ZapA
LFFKAIGAIIIHNDKNPRISLLETGGQKMSSKNTTEVIIDGKIYTLSGYESEAYLQKVGAYINEKIGELKKDPAFLKQSLDTQFTLAELNIADDYFKAKKQADLLEDDLEAKEKTLYDMKHELMAMQIKLDAANKEVASMQGEIVDLQKEIVRYETALKEKNKK